MKPSDEMNEYNKIYEEEGKGFWGVIKGLVNNPTVIPEVLTSSLISMATNTDALKAGGATIGAGAVRGAAIGAVATPEFLGVGAIPGAISGAASAVPYAFGLASTVVESGATFGELLTEELNGKDLTKENVKSILEDPKKLNSIRNKAVARGLIIGTVDALTGKLASGVGAKILSRSAAKSATGAVTKAGVVKSTAAGAAIESLGGSVGEASARAAVGQDMDVSEIALEGLAELPGGVRSTILARTAKPSYKINGEKVNAEDIDELINTMTPEQLSNTKFDIKNDYEGREFKIRDKVLTNSIKEEVRKINPELNDSSLDAITDLEKQLQTLEGNKTQAGKNKVSELKNKIKDIQENQLKEVESAVEEVKPTEVAVKKSGLQPIGDIDANVDRFEIYSGNRFEITLTNVDETGQALPRGEGKKKVMIKTIGSDGTVRVNNALTETFETAAEAKEYANKFISKDTTTEVTPAIEEVKPVEVKPSGQKVTDVINRPATLESQAGVKLDTPIEGDVYQEGQRVIFEDKNKKIYDLGNIDEISDKTVEELGIKPQEEMVSVTPEGKVKVGENEWNMQSELPNYGIEYDKDGNVKAVSLKDDDGKTVMYEGQVAEDAAYQVLLKQTETPEQRQAINEILENDEELNRQLREAEEAAKAAAAEVTEPGAPKTQAEQYSEELDKTKESDPEAYWSVSPVSAADAAKGTIIDTPDGAAIVKPDGDIAGLFKKATSKAKGVAQDLLKRAIAAGGKKLDNFDGYLTKQYEKAGFRIVSRVPFNEEYAPPGWNKELHGTPDVVAMVYDPEGKLDIEEKTFDDYDEAMAYRDSILEIDVELEGLAKLFDESDKGFRMSQVDKAKEALKRILPGVEFIVHETNEAYKKATGESGSGGMYIYRPKTDKKPASRVIHINKQKANGRTVAHEVFHAVILDKIKGDKAVQEITARMVDAVYKTASPELRAELDAFAARYTDKTIRDEERLAELLGIIADGYPKMSQINKGIVKRWLEKLAKMFGRKPFTDNEVIELLNTLAGKISTGEVISAEDVAILSEKEINIPGSQIIGSINIKLRRQAKVADFDTTPPKVEGVNMIYPSKSDIKDVLEKSGGAAVFINSDGTKVGKVSINGRDIIVQGGIDYTFIKENVDDNIGFAASEDSKISYLKSISEELIKERDAKNPQHKGKPIAVFVVAQNGETMLGEWYAAEYIMEGIDQSISENETVLDDIKKDFIDAIESAKLSGNKSGLADRKAKDKVLKMIEEGKFDTQKGRIEIAKEMASKEFSFGFRVNLNKELIAGNEKSWNSGKNRGIKKALSDVGHTMNDFWNKFLDERFLNKLNSTKLQANKGSSISNKTFSGFFYNPSDSLEDQVNHAKLGIDHAQFNSSFKSQENFLLDSAYDVNKLFPNMGYPTQSGIDLYNSKNKTDFNKKNMSIIDKTKVSTWLNNNNSSKLVVNPYSSISLSIYTGTVNEEPNIKEEDKTIIRKQIVGENANLSQNVRDNLEVARDMESSKKSDKEIRLATGWERGADKKWRYEVPDNIPFLKDTIKTVGEFLSEDKDTNQLSQKANYFLPKELLDLYPQLNDITIKFDKVGDESTGSWDPTTNTIEVSIGVYPFKTVSSLIHEVQHAIQEIEGFAEGGGLATSAKLAILSLEKKLGKRIEDTTRKEMVSLKLNKEEENFRTFILNSFYKAKNQKQLLNLIDKESYKVYKNLSGEVEARNAERRMNATPEGRRKTTLQETEDVAREDQVIFFKRSQLEEEGVTINAKSNTSYTVTDNGNIVGSMQLTSDKALGKGYLSVDLSKLNEKYIGKGIGLDLYRTVANKLKDKGIVLTSSMFRNEKSDRVWKSLEKSGEAVEIYSDPRLKKTVYALVNPEVRRSQKVEWEESRIGKGDKAITERQPVLQNAAERYAKKEISYEEYLKIKDVTSPIKPITDFIEPAKEEDIRFAVGINAEGKTNLKFDKGTLLGLRLDINAYINKNIWAITIHAPGKGKVLSYNNVARLKNVTFGSNAKDALNIARHKINKATIARMHGEWIPIEGNTSEEKGKSAMKFVESIVNNPEWSQVGMNPFRHSWFYDRADGKPVLAADELIQIGGLVYAKNVVKTTPYDKAFEFLDQEGDVMRFQEAKGIDEIVRIAKEAKYSDAAISAFLKAKGFSDAEIASALATDRPSVNKIYEDSKKAIEDKKRRVSIKDLAPFLRKSLLDRQAYIKRVINRIDNKSAKKAYDLLVTKAGASALASERFKRAEKKIYGGLSSEDVSTLDKIIYAKRMVAVNESRAKLGLEPYKGMDGYSIDDANKDLADFKSSLGDKKFNDLSNRATEYFDVFKLNLKKLYESGRISEETYESLKDTEYSPIKTIKYIIGDNLSVDEIDTQAKSLGISRNDIMKLSDKNENEIILDSKWLLAMSINSVEGRAFENNMLREFDKAIKEATPEEKKAFEDIILDNPVVGTKKDGGLKYKYDDTRLPVGYTKVSYFNDGNKVEIVLKDQYAKQLLDVKNKNKALETLGKLTGTKILRFFATGGNPLFIIGNTAVDFQNIAFFSDVYSKFKPMATAQLARDYTKNFVKKLFVSNEYNKVFNEYINHGGALDYMASDGLRSLESMNPVKGVTKAVQKGLVAYGRAMSLLGETSEVAFRLSVFQKVKEDSIKEFKKENNREPNAQELDDIMWNAGRQSRETMDFSQGGDVAKNIDAVFPYFNAALQGIRRPIDFATKDPVGFSSSVLQYTVMASSLAAGSFAMLINAVGGDDDEDRAKKIMDAMNSLSEYEKANYHIMFTGEKNKDGEYEYYRVKKLPVLSVISTVAEQLIYKEFFNSKGIEYDMDSKVMLEAVNKSNPLPVTVQEVAGKNPVASGLVSYWANKDTFTGDKIFREPDNKKILPEAEGMFDDRVDQIYKDLAPGFGLSPARTKVMVEKVITSANTNPTIPLIYSAYDGLFNKSDGLGSEVKEAMSGVGDAFGKKVVRYTDKKIIRYKDQDEREYQESVIETKVWNSEQKVYNEIKKKYDGGGNLTNKELIDLVKENFEPMDYMKYAKKYNAYIHNMNIDKSVLDIIFEDVPEVQAMKLNQRYGPNLEGEELKELGKAMNSAGKRINNKSIYIYNKKYKNRKNAQ
jgi:predicted GNAT family acetyltransferase